MRLDAQDLAKLSQICEEEFDIRRILVRMGLPVTTFAYKELRYAVRHSSDYELVHLIVPGPDIKVPPVGSRLSEEHLYLLQLLVLVRRLAVAGKIFVTLTGMNRYISNCEIVERLLEHNNFRLRWGLMRKEVHRELTKDVRKLVYRYQLKTEAENMPHIEEWEDIKD